MCYMFGGWYYLFSLFPNDFFFLFLVCMSQAVMIKACCLTVGSKNGRGTISA